MFVYVYSFIILCINYPVGQSACKHLVQVGFCLNQIFWEHENLSGLSVIRLIQLFIAILSN